MISPFPQYGTVLNTHAGLHDARVVIGPVGWDSCWGHKYVLSSAEHKIAALAAVGSHKNLCTLKSQKRIRFEELPVFSAVINGNDTQPPRHTGVP